MAEPFADPENTQDLHTLMELAVVCGQRGVREDLGAIYECWSLCYPDDALGAIGRGLLMMSRGKTQEGLDLIEEAARSAKTRAGDARGVLTSLKESLAEAEAEIGR